MPERKRLVAGNWKMNGCAPTGCALACGIAERAAAGAMHATCWSARPPRCSPRVGAALAGSGVALGGQDCHAAAQQVRLPADISAEMLADAGCSHVIVGHSERRHGLRRDRRATFAARRAAAWRAGLVAIVCVGETRAAARGRARGRRRRGPARRLDAGRRRRRRGWSSPMSRSGRSAPG